MSKHAIDPTLCRCGRQHPCPGGRLACMGTLLPFTDPATGKQYVDSWSTPHGPYVSSPSCEHCDGERSRYVRHDYVRGWVCPLCDSSLDEMLEEGAYARKCERCQKSAATVHMEYRESCDIAQWPNRITVRCEACATEFRQYVKIVPGFTILVDRPLEADA